MQKTKVYVLSVSHVGTDTHDTCGVFVDFFKACDAAAIRNGMPLKWERYVSHGLCWTAECSSGRARWWYMIEEVEVDFEIVLPGPREENQSEE